MAARTAPATFIALIVAGIVPCLVYCQRTAGPPPASSAPPLKRCLTGSGKVIDNTENDPFILRDKLGCTLCFCVDEDQVSGAGNDSRISQALCMAIDCQTPQCVDPVLEEGPLACCSVCPNGRNCYRGRKRKNPTIIPFGTVFTFRKLVCRCDEKELLFGEVFNEKAICQRNNSTIKSKK